MVDNSLRNPTKQELDVIERLLEMDFIGAQELRKQLPGLLVQTIDKQGSLRIKSGNGPSAPNLRSVPVNGRYKEKGDDGERSPHVNILLHVKCGKISELEIYKDDGGEIIVSPFEVDVSNIEVY